MTKPSSLILAPAAAVAALTLLVAGCGGSGSPGVASVGSSTATTTTTAQDSRVAFSSCMRTHGVPSFPDAGKPTPQQLGVSQSKFDAAVSACSHLIPNGGVAQQTAQQKHKQLEDELSFARCMRGHGVTNFPDPTAQGELTVAMVEAQGIDVRSAAVLHVVQACLPASHGALTMAKVREAIANAGG